MCPKAFGSVELDVHTVVCSIRKLTLKSTKFYSHHILFSYLENLVKLFNYESTFFGENQNNSPASKTDFLINFKGQL